MFIKSFQLAVKITPTHRQSDRCGRVMATINVSHDGKPNVFVAAEWLYCSSDITAAIHDQFTALAVLNAFLSITAFLGNALILVALRKESSLHPPSKVLRGQTSRPVVGTEIQTSCNSEAGLLDRCYILGCFHCPFNNAVFEYLYNLVLWNYTYIILSSNFDLFLYKDFPHPPPPSKPNTRTCSTTEPNKSIEHRSIQEGSVPCTVFKVHVTRLLSATSNIANFAHSC